MSQNAAEQLPGRSAYKFGRVIRLKQADVEAFIEASWVPTGTLKHRYPDVGEPGRVPAACIPPGDARADHQSVGA